MTLLAYTRVSTVSQSDGLQRDAVIAAGVEERHVYSDVISGGTGSATRPGFAALLAYARPDDEIVVWRIDRLGRSLLDVLSTV